jgi:hypothetical protein
MTSGLIIGGIIGIVIGYHIGIWHGLIRLGNAERKARMGRIGYPWKRRD